MASSRCSPAAGACVDDSCITAGRWVPRRQCVTTWASPSTAPPPPPSSKYRTPNRICAASPQLSCKGCRLRLVACGMSRTAVKTDGCPSDNASPPVQPSPSSSHALVTGLLMANAPPLRQMGTPLTMRYRLYSPSPLFTGSLMTYVWAFCSCR